MTENQQIVTCSDCGAVTNTNSDTTNFRSPCKECGSKKRTYNVCITENVVARDGYGIKAKHQGEKRPYIEELSTPDYSRDRKKLVHRRRVIDRDSDKYLEKITDYETGEIIHQCEEPLSNHQGHGSAKRKKKTN